MRRGAVTGLRVSSLSAETQCLLHNGKEREQTVNAKSKAVLLNRQLLPITQDNA